MAKNNISTRLTTISKQINYAVADIRRGNKESSIAVLNKVNDDIEQIIKDVTALEINLSNIVAQIQK